MNFWNTRIRESTCIWKENQVRRNPLQKPVRLQKAEVICGIIQKMSRDGLPEWTLTLYWMILTYKSK